MISVLTNLLRRAKENEQVDNRTPMEKRLALPRDQWPKAADVLPEQPVQTKVYNEPQSLGPAAIRTSISTKTLDSNITANLNPISPISITDGQGVTENHIRTLDANIRTVNKNVNVVNTTANLRAAELSQNLKIVDANLEQSNKMIRQSHIQTHARIDEYFKWQKVAASEQDRENQTQYNEQVADYKKAEGESEFRKSTVSAEQQREPKQQLRQRTSLSAFDLGVLATYAGQFAAALWPDIKKKVEQVFDKPSRTAAFVAVTKEMLEIEKRVGILANRMQKSYDEWYKTRLDNYKKFSDKYEKNKLEDRKKLNNRMEKYLEDMKLPGRTEDSGTSYPNKITLEDNPKALSPEDKKLLDEWKKEYSDKPVKMNLGGRDITGPLPPATDPMSQFKGTTFKKEQSIIAQPQSFRKSMIEQEKSQFMKFGALPRGFEHVEGHRGILGKPAAVHAAGAIPSGGYSGRQQSIGQSSYTPVYSRRNISSSGHPYSAPSKLGGPKPTQTIHGAPQDGAVDSEAYADYSSNVSVDRRGKVDKQEYYNAAVKAIADSPLNGFVPEDGEKYGIDGSPESWAKFQMRLTHVESGFNVNTTNMSDPGGSLGLLQWGKHYGITGKNWKEPSAQTNAFINYAQKWVVGGGGYIQPPREVKAKRYTGYGGFAAVFSTVRNNKQNSKAARNIANKLAAGAPPRRQIAGLVSSGSIEDADTSLPKETPLLTPEMMQPRRMPTVDQSIKTLSKPDTSNISKTAGNSKVNVVKSPLPGYGGRGRRSAKYEYIGVHYTAGNSLSSAMNTARQTNVGYQYLIDKDGTIHEVLDPEKGYSNHWGKNNVHPRARNNNSVGISFVGTEGNITDAQRNAGVAFVEKTRQKYNIDPKNVLGHGETTRRHRSNREGHGILVPFRQMHGIKNPNIARRSESYNEWLKKHSNKIGAPGENMPESLTKFLRAQQKPTTDVTELDPNSPLYAQQKLAEIRANQTVIPKVPSGIEADPMSPAEPIAEQKSFRERLIERHQSGQGASTARDFSKDPPIVESAPPGIGPTRIEKPPVMEKPHPQPDPAKSAAIAMGDVEVKNEVQSRAADVVETDKKRKNQADADTKAAQYNSGSGGTPSMAHHPESEPPAAGSSGYGSFGRCWV